MNPHVQWLLTTGRFAESPTALLSGLARRLCEDGFDLVRINLQPFTLHPEIEMVLYLWRLKEGQTEMRADAPVVESARLDVAFGVAQEVATAHGGIHNPAFLASPIFAILSGAPSVRARIDAGATEFQYPILRDFAAAGATDYCAWPLKLSDDTRCVISLTTQKAFGFTDVDIETLEALLDPLALCIDTHLRARFARTLLHTYLGPGPGEAVLAGRIRRGDVQRMEAAIWFSDLRGFTDHSSKLEPTALVGWLNEYFSAIATPIAAEGGDILKFIGDAVLAVFLVTPERSRADACRAALAAARAANAALDALNADRVGRGLPELAHGIGLHVGEVQYGNIGAIRRLDFTVIGQAVNLASRIESLCGKLGRRTLASEELAALAEGGLTPVGNFELKGIPGERAIYELSAP